jgi:hypothetical protein
MQIQTKTQYGINYKLWIRPLEILSTEPLQGIYTKSAVENVSNSSFLSNQDSMIINRLTDDAEVSVSNKETILQNLNLLARKWQLTLPAVIPRRSRVVLDRNSNGTHIGTTNNDYFYKYGGNNPTKA